jgi:dihydroxyacetone kinase
MLSKAVINDADRMVLDSTEGLVLSRPDLVLLDGFPGVKVVARRRIDRAKVAIVCGGGSGHEPAHAGLVGEGLLTAAVCGEVFCSPNVAAIFAALMHTAGSAGTLLVVKNYTGDRLAFAPAAERARAQGVKVEVVYVADDAGVEGSRVIGRRGLAGTVLVYKAAGGLAEAGAPLADVAAAAQALAGRVATMGAALTVCAIPGRVPSDRLAGPGCELGLGVHGEPGARRLPGVPSADALCATLLGACAARVTDGRPE